MGRSGADVPPESAARLRRRWVYAGMYGFLLLFFALTVRSGDDLGRWAKWYRVLEGPAGPYDLSQWSTWGHLTLYQDLNGRVVGNLMHLFLIDSWPLNVLVRATIVLALVWAIARVARIRRLWLLPLILALVLAPGLKITTQAIFWSAGFFNYVTPVLLLLLLVLLRRREAGLWPILGAFVIAVCASLFMETITLFAALAAAGCWAWSWIRRRRPGWIDTAVLAGFVVGGTIMFLSPGYRIVGTGEDERRSISGSGSIFGRLLNHGGELVHGTVIWMLPVLILFVLAIVWAVARPGANALPWQRFLLGAMLGAFALLVIYAPLMPSASGRLRTLTGVALLVLFGVFILSASALLALRARRVAPEAAASRAALACLVFAVVLILPFVVVTPFTPRVLYPSAVLLLLAVLLLHAERIGTVRLRWPARVAVLVVPAVVLLGLLGPMVANKAAELRLYRAVEAAMDNGEHVFHYPEYPFPELVKRGDVKSRIAQLATGVYCPVLGTCDDYEFTVILPK